MAKNMMKQLRRRQKLQEARDEAKDLAVNYCEDFLSKADITILYTLHKVFGFGKKRAERFYLNLVINQHEMISQYRTDSEDDETHYLIMADRLKKAGIDVEALQAKAEAIKAPECDYEARQRLIKEMMGK
jgi:hypothetical protein